MSAATHTVCDANHAMLSVADADAFRSIPWRKVDKKNGFCAPTSAASNRLLAELGPARVVRF